MLFNSLEFLLFFPVVTLLYFVLPLKWRWLLLLVASCAFYMAFIPEYVLIILGTVVVDYFAGLMIARSTGARRKAYLVASLVANIGALAVFKYCNFIITNANAVFYAFHSATRLATLDITLPIGLSFHTFQAMSYTIEVYRRKQEPERNFIVYALYVIFYPQLVAGPIERPQNVIHQLRELHRFDPQQTARGLRRVLWGFFKKCVVADRLAMIVNAVYGAPQAHTGPMLLLATGAFAFQIYADFSGYSDIALGTAEVMGIKLMTNFRQPYMAQSVREFWSRWHISLSTWFRDYLYIPLGGNRVGPVRRRANLFFTFLVSGLWHGANWTYVIWGALNGLFLIVESSLVSGKRAVGSTPWSARARIAITFVLVTFAWVFFRANTIGDALYIVTHFGKDFAVLAHPVKVSSEIASVATDVKRFAFTCLSLSVLVLVDRLASNRNKDPAELFDALPRTRRWGAYYALAMALVLLGLYGRQQFIYFQF